MLLFSHLLVLFAVTDSCSRFFDWLTSVSLLYVIFLINNNSLIFTVSVLLQYYFKSKPIECLNTKSTVSFK